MSLVMVMAVNHTHTDPEKDQRGCYKRGDVVEVFEDDAHNGDLVANPIMAPFAMVRIRSGAIGSLGAAVAPGDTIIPLNAGQGGQSINPPWFAVIGDQPFSGTGEVVRCTAINGDNLTVNRGLRGTTAQAWPAGMAIERIITKAQTEKYLAPEKDVNGKPVRRRVWWVLVDTLPAGILADLQADRWVTVTWSQVRNFIQNKQTGATEGAAEQP